MSISSNEEWHHAKVGLFLVDGDNEVYGLTCKHVTAFSTDGNIYVKTHSGAMEPVGHVLYCEEASELSTKTDSKFQCDADIFKVNCQFERCCSNLRHSSAVIFEKSRDDLFGSSVSSISDGKITLGSFENCSTKEVCHTSVDGKNSPNDNANIIRSIAHEANDIDVLRLNNVPLLPLNLEPRTNKAESDSVNDNGVCVCITGQIESDEVHDSEKADLPDYNFLLQSSGAPFNPGDSGTVIVRENKGAIELIGVVTGSFESEKRGKDYVACLLLTKGLQLLNSKYNKQFRVLQQSAKVEKFNDDVIFAGSEIWIKITLQSVKSPEDIAEIDYQFVEIIHNLVDNMKDDDISSIKLQLEEENEKRLSTCVSKMEDLDGSLCDSPAVRCYYLCMNGCSFLYKGQYSESMKELSAAAKMITRLPCRNRLLCRMITYATWNLLKTEKLGEMKEILAVAESYMAEMRHINVCPNSSMGYYFFDYARFYIRRGMNDNALEKANAALVQFRQGKKPSVGKILALAMVARLYLSCGDDFERMNDKIVASRINEAQELLHEARQSSANTIVEETTILLTEIDLYYRAGNVERALKLARKCFDVASENSLKEEQQRANIRIKSMMEMSSKLRKL